MSAIPTHQYMEFYQEYEKQRYRDFMLSLSDHISFDSDTWICEKRLKSQAQLLSKVSIYFSKIPKQYREMVKYYALLRLIEGVGITTACTNVGNIAKFLNFPDAGELQSITVTTVSRFKEHLDSKGYAESTRSCIWADLRIFLRKMNGFDGMNLRNPFYNNPYESNHLVDQKYIPKCVAKQLDRAFMDEKIPVTMRCVYWLLRLIPSRISEILGMKIDCVKPFDGRYCIFIPTWKQNGGYREAITRVIHIKNEGIGAHLISLVHEQQKMALSYQPYLLEKKQGALFAYRREILVEGIWRTKNNYSVASWPYVSYQFKEICKRHRIRDEDGIDYVVTSHQFRHNGVTDRLRAGFTLMQIAEMTGHHGTAMLSASYAHLNLFPETIVEPLKYQTEAENPYVLFAGKILNMDAITESRLLKNIRAHRVTGGICSDVTHCKSGLWSCIDCVYFVPEVEQLPYFKEQVIAWAEKAERFKRDGQMYNNYDDIARKFRGIVEKLGGM